MEKYADLHIHTHFSDSTSSPEEVAFQAHKNNVDCIAITDHDVVDGVKPTMEAALEYNVEVLPGVELSSEINGKDVHILGYMFDLENKNFLDQLIVMQKARIVRMQKMIEKLNTLGIDCISLDEVCALTNSDAVGRPHLAEKLIEYGVVSNMREAFNKYLAEGALAYMPKYNISPFEAIDLIKSAGGVSILAHPMVTAVDEFIPKFVEAGLGGLEVYYANNSKAVTSFYEGLAKKHNILMTGGSDSHGNAKKHTYIGKAKIPYELVESLKEKAAGV